MANRSMISFRLIVISRLQDRANLLLQRGWPRKFGLSPGKAYSVACCSRNNEYDCDGGNYNNSYSTFIHFCSSDRLKSTPFGGYRNYYFVRNLSTSASHHGSAGFKSNNAAKAPIDLSHASRKNSDSRDRRVQKSAGHIKGFVKKYGVYAVGTYFAIFSMTLSGFYSALVSGAIDPLTITTFWGGEMGDGEDEVDAVKMVANLLEKWEWTKKYSEHVEQNPKLTYLGIAWLGTKITEPFRFAATVFLTPRVANVFGKAIVEGDVEHQGDGDTNEKISNKENVPDPK